MDFWGYIFMFVFGIVLGWGLTFIYMDETYRDNISKLTKSLQDANSLINYFIEMDRKGGLGFFFEKQEHLMNLIEKRTGTKGTPALTLTALMVEAGELLNEDGSFKWWKLNHKQDWEKIKEEYVDIFFFWIQYGIMVGINPDEITEEYMRKWEIDIKRQLENY